MSFTFPMHGTRMACQKDFLHAGQAAMYTPTVLHVSCMAKIGNIHEQWLFPNIPTVPISLVPRPLFPFLFVVEKSSLFSVICGGKRQSGNETTYLYIVYNVYK